MSQRQKFIAMHGKVEKSTIGQKECVLRDRRREHPARHLCGFTGILQANAYSHYNEFYDASRAPGPITPALCWVHARRQFFELFDIARNARRGKNAVAISPIAFEAVMAVQ